MVKISDYTPITTLEDDDLFDLSEYDSTALTYETRSISYANLVTNLHTSLNTTSIVDAASDPAANTRVVFYSATIAAGTMYLPAVSAGKIVTFIRVANAGTSANVGTTGAGVTINGAATFATSTVLYAVQTAYCDGTNWFIG